MPVIKIINRVSSKVAIKSLNGIIVRPLSVYEDFFHNDIIDIALIELNHLQNTGYINYIITDDINDFNFDVPIYRTTDARLRDSGQHKLIYDTDLQTLFVWNSVLEEWQAAGGGGGGAITVQDEGLLVNNTVSIINFVGVDVTTASVSATKVNVYIPPPSYSPFYNIGSCSITSLPTSNRHVSQPSMVGFPFGIGSWVAGSVHACHQDTPSLTFNTPIPCSFINDTNTTFEVTIYGDDDVTPLETFTTPVINSNANHASVNLSVNISNWAVDNDRFRADIDVTIDIGTLLPSGGRYSISLIHHNNGTDYSFSQGPIFMDQELTTADLSGVTIGETLGNVILVYISGVPYYTTGSHFTIDIADIDNLNDSSYPTTQVSMICTDYGLPNLALAGSAFTGWTLFWNDLDDSYTKTDCSVNAVQFCSVDPSALISGRTEDWVSGAYQNSAVSPICVNTYTNNSTRIYEDFRLEDNRLESDFNTVWDNTQNLTTYDGNNGLQFQCSRLIFPQTDFNNFNPNFGASPNYSGIAGSRIFRRRWWHDGVSHSNGLFQLSDFTWTEADIASDDLLLEISLDGINWFVLNENYLGGALGNGDGCRINPGVNSLDLNGSIEFTLGTGGFTSIGTGGGWGVYMRVTYSGANISKYMGVLQITNW